MTKNQTPKPSKTLYALLNGPPIKAQGAFWHAFFLLQKKGADAARAFLKREFFTDTGAPKDSPRDSLLFALSADFPPDLKSLGWPELFAIAGVCHSLTHLVQSEKISAIHALHNDIELSPRFFPNPMLEAPEDEIKLLLDLYAIEEEILLNSPHSNFLLREWLQKRRTRALAYFDTIKFCQNMRTA